jgi:hypothetical protein
MKILILLLFAIIHFTFTVNAQNSDSSKTKQHFICAAITLKDGNKNYGGSLKYEFAKNDKLGVGLKTLLYKNQYYDYSASNYYITEKPDLYLIFEGVLTRYLLGNLKKSNAGVYVELGIGYHLDKQSSVIKYTNYPSFNEKYLSQGLGCTLAIGSRLKMGRGNLFAEVMLGGILMGSYYERFIFPEGYPGLSNGNPYPNNGPDDSGTGFALLNGYPFINDGLISINFGYRINLK